MARANVVALHSFSDDEALVWLSDHLEGRVEMRPGRPRPAVRLVAGRGCAAGSPYRPMPDASRSSRAARVKVILTPTRTSKEAATQLVGHAFSIAAASHSSAAEAAAFDRRRPHGRRAVSDRARADRGRPRHERAPLRPRSARPRRRRCCSPRSGSRSTCSRW